MDDHFRVDVFILFNAGNGAEHVSYCRKIKKTNGKILWNEIYCVVRIFGTTLFHLCWYHVPGKNDPGKEGVAGPASKQQIINKECHIKATKVLIVGFGVSAPVCLQEGTLKTVRP